RDVSLITVLLPLALLIAYVLLKSQYHGESRRSVGWPMLLGVWLLGGFFMVVGASFSGAGFVGPERLSDGIKTILISVVPIFFIDLATYDGSLGALAIVSVVALLVRVWTLVANKRLRKLE